MKKAIHLFLIYILFLFISFQSKAQFIIGTFHTDSCAFQRFLVYADEGTTGAPYKIALFFGDGTSDTLLTGTGSTNPDFTIFKHNYSMNGVYSVKSILLNATMTKVDSDTISVDYKSCTNIKGGFYIDKNINCLFDAGDEKVFAAAKVIVDSNGILIDTIYAFDNFEYPVSPTSTATYGFSLLEYSSGLTYGCPVSGKLTAKAIKFKSVNAGNFGFSCTSAGADISVYGSSVVGRHTLVLTGTIASNSCINADGTFSITIDPRFSIFKKTLPAGGVISGNTITWNYTNQSLNSTNGFFVHCEAPVWLIPGDEVKSYLEAKYSADTDTSNNKALIIDTVRASWDPNEKTVSPSGFVASGTTLNYTLSFENTGNATAKNIHILDTLDANLDINTLQILTSSHKFKLYKERDPSTGKIILKFDFPFINLKDSSHKGECNGFVMFSIQIKSGLPNGTDIPNRVGIYFDENEVVLTNTVISEINVLSIPKQSNNPKILIYPNPSDDVFIIESPIGTFKDLKIINSLGKVLIQQTCEGTITKVSTSTLIPGIYYILLNTKNGVRIEKIEKK